MVEGQMEESGKKEAASLNSSGRHDVDNLESLSDSLYDSFSSCASQGSNDQKLLSVPGLGLQIQCYQCEEFQLNNDCSAPEFIVNCTVNVQDMCQKEVMEKSVGIMYRKSCASSAACLIASAGYQSFCSPGKVNSVCISCCNTPLCNGPRPKKRGNSGVVLRPHVITTILLLKLVLLGLYC
ncbi:PREDICTED: ly6/PLAUR domain-containing protein 1 [Chaetura pelagica]|uniref:ly6/PLAUR domain-containing protein 1 n=1 Tax=Chaetura pelagica TaxID=8897 RepID=UPI0005234B7D|nr:PREDICTED: ly6/PLAUR domain-containing protein 1 [Chaetura pelagica]